MHRDVKSVVLQFLSVKFYSLLRSGGVASGQLCPDIPGSHVSVLSFFFSFFFCFIRPTMAESINRGKLA